MFFQWVMMYNNLLSNITGKDRVAMLKVLEDDRQFDLWYEAYVNKLNTDSGGGSGGGAGTVRISSAEYERRYAKVYGGEEEA